MSDVSQDASTTVDDDTTQPVSTAALAVMPRLAKRTAIDSLLARLLNLGLDARAAELVAHAVVDPAEARRRLDRLTAVRVPGATILSLDTLVWAPAIVSYVGNNREAVVRHYPAGVEPGTAEAARYRPLRSPEDDGIHGPAMLHVSAEEPAHLVWSLERSVKFLEENNPLAASISAQGVMQHVSVAAVSVGFEDGHDAVTMLGTIDGSSRTAGAHSVLGLTPHDVVMKFPHDRRAFRGFIAGVEAALDRPLEEVSEDDVHRLRALQIPARIFLQHQPDPVAPVGFAKATDSYVHLIHVEPPKPWDVAAGLDAKAISVLSELEGSGAITPNRRLYYEGMFTPEEARRHGFPGEPDERALEIVAVMSSEQAKKKQAVRTGVIVLSKKGQVRREEKASIAVELALRANRSTLNRSDAKGARETLQNVYLHARIWGKELKPAKGTLEELRQAAIEELEAGAPGTACRRIAAQGSYWLAVHRVLREARFFADKDQRDGRSAQRVMDDLMHTRWGIEVFYRAIIDGREGLPLARVDKTGRRVAGISGEPMEMKHDWLRGEVVPPQAPLPAGNGDGKAPDPGPTLPTRILLTRRQALETAVSRLEYAHQELRNVLDTDGAVLVDKEGLSLDVTNNLAERLALLGRQLDRYGMKWEATNIGTATMDTEADAFAELDA